MKKPFFLLQYAFLSIVPVRSFSLQYGARNKWQIHAVGDADSNVDDVDNHPWLHCGLLFSSLTDGLMENEPAKTFLRRGILRSRLLEARSQYEQQITTSVLASPCNGPDVHRLGDLERVDAALAFLDDDTQDASCVIHEKMDMVELPEPLRLVYIPTALYALRRDSTNTPGKQRQRARADGKKRRQQVVEFLRQECGCSCGIAAVTLDLYDGSLKHVEGTNSLPTNDDSRQLLYDWKPHVVYVEGGNTFWLQHCCMQGRWMDYLRDYLRLPGTVYLGKSAGAILAGTVTNTAFWKGWDDPTVVPGTDDHDDEPRLQGLDVLGGARSVFPHMDDSWSDVVAQRRKELDHTVDLLEETDVLCVDGRTKSVNLYWGMS